MINFRSGNAEKRVIAWICKYVQRQLAKAWAQSNLNAALKLDCGSDGAVYVDALITPNAESNENLEAGCNVNMPLEDLRVS